MYRTDAGLNRDSNVQVRASILIELGCSTSIRRFTPTALGKLVRWDHYCWLQVSTEEMKRMEVGLLYIQGRRGSDTACPMPAS